VSENLELTWMLLVHLALTGAPAAAAMLLALRAGARSVPILLGIALAGSGAGAMLAFWSYYADPMLGQVVSFLLVLGSVQVIVWTWRSGVDRAVLRSLATPAALWALGSAFVVFLGFLHGGQAEPLLTAATRFSHPLPGDNYIPLYFAEWFYVHGHDGPPPDFATWLSSDRPPLQSGYVLAQRPFGWDESGLRYQVLGVVVQQLWIVGMWSVLTAARVRPSTRGLAILAAMVGDAAILHGFFVWPKLLAATFLLAALAIVISPDWPQLRRNPAVAALFAGLCGLAMLAHGGSVFVLLPLLLLGVLRGLPSWRWIGVAALVGLVALGPWTAYQRFADPPGDRLLKWHLAGSLEITDESALGVIADSYADAGLEGTLENKWDNLALVAAIGQTTDSVEEAVDYAADGDLESSATVLRVLRFFYLAPLLGIFLLGALAMAVARARGRPQGPEWRFAVLALAFCALATLTWALLLFGNVESSTRVHAGSLFVPLLAVCACVVGLRTTFPRLALALVAVNSVAVLALYGPSLTPPPGTSYSLLAGLLAAAALAGFGFLCLRGEPGRGERARN
jgi:hypothetical protein